MPDHSESEALAHLQAALDDIYPKIASDELQAWFESLAPIYGDQKAAERQLLLQARILHAISRIPPNDAVPFVSLNSRILDTLTTTLSAVDPNRNSRKQIWNAILAFFDRLKSPTSSIEEFLHRWATDGLEHGKVLFSAAKAYVALNKPDRALERVISCERRLPAFHKHRYMRHLAVMAFDAGRALYRALDFEGAIRAARFVEETLDDDTRFKALILEGMALGELKRPEDAGDRFCEGFRLLGRLSTSREVTHDIHRLVERYFTLHLPTSFYSRVATLPLSGQLLVVEYEKLVLCHRQRWAQLQPLISAGIDVFVGDSKMRAKFLSEHIRLQDNPRECSDIGVSGDELERMCLQVSDLVGNHLYLAIAQSSLAQWKGDIWISLGQETLEASEASTMSKAEMSIAERHFRKVSNYLALNRQHKESLKLDMAFRKFCLRHRTADESIRKIELRIAKRLLSLGLDTDAAEFLTGAITSPSLGLEATLVDAERLCLSGHPRDGADKCITGLEYCLEGKRPKQWDILRGQGYQVLSAIAFQRGNLPSAITYATTSRMIFKRLRGGASGRYLLKLSLDNLSWMAYLESHRGTFERAKDFLREALERCEESNIPAPVWHFTFLKHLLEIDCGEVDEPSADLFHELKNSKEMDFDMIRVAIGAADILGRSGRRRKARSLLADVLRAIRDSQHSLNVFSKTKSSHMHKMVLSELQIRRGTGLSHPPQFGSSEPLNIELVHNSAEQLKSELLSPRVTSRKSCSPVLMTPVSEATNGTFHGHLERWRELCRRFLTESSTPHPWVLKRVANLLISSAFLLSQKTGMSERDLEECVAVLDTSNAVTPWRLTNRFEQPDDGRWPQDNLPELEHYDYEAVLRRLFRDVPVVLFSYDEDDRALVIARLELQTSPLFVQLPISRSPDHLSYPDTCQELATILRENEDSRNRATPVQWHKIRLDLEKRMGRVKESMEHWIGGAVGTVAPGPVVGIHSIERLQREFALDHFFSGALQVVTSGFVSDAGDDALGWKLDDLAVLLNVQEREKFKEFMKEILQSRDNLGRLAKPRILIIPDRNLTKLPWESMAVYDQTGVYRLPSLRFFGYLLSKSLSFSLDDGADPFQVLLPPAWSPSHSSVAVRRARVGFIVNPSGDIKNLTNEFKQYIEENDSAEFIVDRRPGRGEFKRLLETKDLVIYGGHGHGLQYIPRAEIENLRRCSVTLLFGCSSARLEEHGSFEPDGPPWAYLIGGCPAVFGNLWAVTNRDFNLFTKEMLNLWLRQSEGPMCLGQAVCSSRNKPEFQFLTGMAPVVYGLPVFVTGSGT